MTEYKRTRIEKYGFVFYFYIACCVFFVLYAGIRFVLPNISTKTYKLCLESSILHSGKSVSLFDIDISSYSLISSSLPVIKANEALNRKYAKRYSIFKDIENTEKEDVLIGENVLETDLSSGGITFINTPNYSISAEELLSSPLSFLPYTKSPKVLIVHTHTSEAYVNSPGARSEDQSENVVAVGSEIASALEKNGIPVIHDKTRNDYPSYNGSYKKCLETIEKNLSMYPEIEIVLDIHRDYIERDGNELKPTANVKGEKLAQIMFVIGTDNMGLFHPDWRHNLSFATKIQNELNRKAPNLCRAINIRTERFNQHATKGSMIIEVGSSANTLEEAKNSGQYIGEAIAQILKKI